MIIIIIWHSVDAGVHWHGCRHFGDIRGVSRKQGQLWGSLWWWWWWRVVMIHIVILLRKNKVISYKNDIAGNAGAAVDIMIWITLDIVYIFVFSITIFSFAILPYFRFYDNNITGDAEAATDLCCAGCLELEPFAGKPHHHIIEIIIAIIIAIIIHHRHHRQIIKSSSSSRLSSLLSSS